MAVLKPFNSPEEAHPDSNAGRPHSRKDSVDDSPQTAQRCKLTFTSQYVTCRIIASSWEDKVLADFSSITALSGYLHI
ncbi:hypothetical protein GN244_ATG02133 [Phytophthora infestans]|uniref:Uncharacterized protein n=1 Tax=Phytophthora infestans TaxID=4787 RepID=A0A833SSV3_PHYIN|nr:hypothetical protein GN244_ATG02133 [Phytophthora infestans]